MLVVVVEVVTLDTETPGYVTERVSDPLNRLNHY